MKEIQTIADLNALKQQEHIPNHYVEEIIQQFLAWQRELSDEELESLQFPLQICMYHLDNQEDAEILLNLKHDIEYVNLEKIEGTKFFRIGLMQEHQISLLFVLENILSKEIKKWLYELGGRENV